MKKNFLIDMDGVLVHGSKMVPGADKFIESLKAEKRKFAILTNNSKYTTRDLAHRLKQTGLDIDEESIFTSAIATAEFLNNQRPNGTAFVIGEVGLTEAIHSQARSLCLSASRTCWKNNRALGRLPWRAACIPICIRSSSVGSVPPGLSRPKVIRVCSPRMSRNLHSS